MLLVQMVSKDGLCYQQVGNFIFSLGHYNNLKLSTMKMASCVTFITTQK